MKTFSLSFAVLALSLSALAEERPLSNFSKIEISGDFDLEVTKGTKFSVSLDSKDPLALKQTLTVVDDRKLKISRESDSLSGFGLRVTTAEDESGFSIHFEKDKKKKGASKAKVLVKVTLPNLEAIDTSSAAKVVVNAFEVDTFDLEASSGSSILLKSLKGNKCSVETSSGASVRADGKCLNVTVDSSSGALVDLKNVESKSVEVDSSSGASVEVWATESIDADASSGANVRVHGAPKSKKTDQSSAGSVRFDAN